MWLLAVKRGKGWRGIDPALRCWLALLHSADFRSWVSDFGRGVKPQLKVTNPWSKSVTHDRISVRCMGGGATPHRRQARPHLIFRAAGEFGGGVRLQQDPRVTQYFLCIFSGAGRCSPLSCQGCPVPLVVENNDAFSFLHRTTKGETHVHGWLLQR